MDLSKRTLGDGMDNSLLTFSELVSRNVEFRSKIGSNSMKPIIPVGPIIKTIPKYIPKERKKPKYLTKKPKEPKFIPYEPFKGAVQPIIPRKKILKIQSPRTKNNIDIQDLVQQMRDIRTVEFIKVKSEALECNETLISKRQWDEERKGYETDIKNLRETNMHLENQLKFQAQVNSELKTLLVAAVGEDLESRVQHLTEDKLQLARALLNSANHLTSHQEQTEWLSGQCEVWRSKFLASSLMVEELARWKSALVNRINELQGNIKVLLDERNNVKTNSLKCYSLLLKIHESIKELESYKKMKSANIIDVALDNYKLGEAIGQKLVGNIEFDDELLKLITNTPGEIMAVKLLKNPVTLVSKPDEVCNALVGAAMSLNPGQMYLQHPANHATCCKHCKGESYNL